MCALPTLTLSLLSLLSAHEAPELDAARDLHGHLELLTNERLAETASLHELRLELLGDAHGQLSLLETIELHGLELRPLLLELARIAENLLSGVPKADLAEMIRTLEYFNSRFAEGNRAAALRHGSKSPTDRSLGESVRKALGQETYLSSSSVCRCCGR